MPKSPEVQQKQHQVRIEIDDTVADGTYANLAFVSNNNSEFILDFARFLPGNTRGKVISRIVFTPVNVKGFLKSLTDSVDNYEKKFGTIHSEKTNKNIGFQVNAEKPETDSD